MAILEFTQLCGDSAAHPVPLDALAESTLELKFFDTAVFRAPQHQLSVADDALSQMARIASAWSRGLEVSSKHTETCPSCKPITSW